MQLHIMQNTSVCLHNTSMIALRKYRKGSGCDWLLSCCPLLTQTNTLSRHCWVCFATERDDHSAEWVSPCRCKGCTKWIHQSCLQRWLDEKQKGNSGGAVSCPQCGTEYHITFPKMGK